MPKLGFEFRETMTGSFSPTGRGAQQAPSSIKLSLRVFADDALRHARDHLARAEGEIAIFGLATAAACAGTMEIAPLSRRRIRYELGFVGDDGRPYRFVGQKDVRLVDFAATMTTLPAEVLGPDGKVVGRATVTFDLNADLLPFLASWKPLLARA
jgi:hypothetical protein